MKLCVIAFLDLPRPRTHKFAMSAIVPTAAEKRTPFWIRFVPRADIAAIDEKLKSRQLRRPLSAR
jgi:hypothetical protein